ncbi:hypothetical protein FPANT_9792 [Fusarium pseudoanthophilum]|uniref:Uncharacterized protein n=1 Tax=Fusarium pseudoanthophilum TaxID=48495 RepID=A0A8H5NX58_9HYPO|nr:hypothetical protein FPANT_9792 [Fusarium pseudoanthophilum]
MSWTRKKTTGPVPPPPSFTPKLSATYTKKRASNNGHGTDDALAVTRILEAADIPCCMVGTCALIFYGAARDWEICVPTHLVDKAVALLQSELHAATYHVEEPWDKPSSSLIHNWKRFKHHETNFGFVIVPDRDVHIVCEPSNFTRSLRGLPYPKLHVFIQSCLDIGDELQLCDVIDGTDLPEEWGEENLELDGTNDVEWVIEANKRGRDSKDEKFAKWSTFACNPRSRRALWQSYVRTKKDRLPNFGDARRDGLAFSLFSQATLLLRPCLKKVPSYRTLKMVRYFGKDSPTELRDLERNAVRADDTQMAKAASMLQEAFDGKAHYAWFGGWALKLRGSSRETKDLDLLVLADDVRQVRAILSAYSWAILAYYEIMGSMQERMFVDIGEDGQVVGVDIVLSGKPIRSAGRKAYLGEEDSLELITPCFETPQGSQVPVIPLTWQVECKLRAWMSRKKQSDFFDLKFLFRKYGREEISQWSEHLSKDWRREFYEVFRVEETDEEALKEMMSILQLD